MDFNLSEWLNLIARWVHVFAAILWVGTTYYFTWLDGQLRAMEGPAKAGHDRDRRVWMVHSGGFYTVEKQPSLGVAPDALHWFRWEAATTWLSGFALLAIVYYAGGALVDVENPRLSDAAAVGVGIGALVAGWIVYDLLARSPLVRSDIGFAAVALACIVAAAVALDTVFSSRATYIHIGGMLGTIMAANVWMRILPPQRRMIAAVARGDAIDPAHGAGAKQRSKHNTFMAVPVVFIMISSHFPIATYGNRYSTAVLAVLMVVGWAAAAVLRRA
jgi:uncharacterized membrane protein